MDLDVLFCLRGLLLALLQISIWFKSQYPANISTPSLQRQEAQQADQSLKACHVI